MEEKYMMALDQGTTSSRCILFNKAGEIVSMAQKEFEQIYPKPGWVEHNPVEIWASQLAVAVEAMVSFGVKPEQIQAIGITNQRETTICWDKNTGEPVYHGICWQCRRTADRIEQLKKDGLEESIRNKTGLIPDAYFSASKIAWILENVEGARQKADAGELLFGTVDSWLVWNLTKGKLHITDYTNASVFPVFLYRKSNNMLLPYLLVLSHISCKCLLPFSHFEHMDHNHHLYLVPHHEPVPSPVRYGK